MTITEEQKEKAIELYNKGINKTDILTIVGIKSYPTLRNILKGDGIKNDINDNNDSGKLQEKAKQTEKTLTDIFYYENYTEESVIDLIFNLKRIAKESGEEDLGAFIGSIEILFTQYYKKTENTIKLFNFILEISEALPVITDHTDIDVIISVIDNFVNREIAMENADKYLAESKTEKEDIIEELKERWDNFQKRISNAKKEATKEVEMRYETILKNSKETYKEYTSKIDSAKKNLDALNLTRAVLIEELEKTGKIETENLELRKLFEQTDKENSSLKVVLQRITSAFPREIEGIWSEIQHEQSK